MSDLNGLVLQKEALDKKKKNDDDEMYGRPETKRQQKLHDLASLFVIPKRDSGPFVLDHDNLTVSNVLVGDFPSLHPR